jgi:hypothetical protein
MTTESPSGSPVDLYTLRARVAPAVLAASPALALAVGLLPLLPGAQELWTLLAIGVTTFAALVARRAGNRVQPALWASWGGMPTTSRLRYRDNPSSQEVTRRHDLLVRVLGDGLVLPDEEHEAQDPLAADAEYEAANRRLIARVRNRPEHWLLQIENRNYGYSRNLLGLRTFAMRCAVGTLLVCAIAVVVAMSVDEFSLAPLMLPVAVSGAALVPWRMVDEAFVRPSAEAYADRLMDALEDLAQSTTA